MKKAKFLFIVPLILLLFAASCFKNDHPSFAFPPVDVSTIKIEPLTIPVSTEFVGFTVSSHSVEIRARVDGYLEEIGFNEGELVRKGDLLFKLDPKPFEAALENAKGVLAQNEAVLWNAKRNAERLKPLVEQKAASQKDLDAALSEKLHAEAGVQSAKAQVNKAELDLSYTTITSPYDGMAGKSNFREGALITTYGNQGLLTTVSALDPMWVDFNISESDLLKMKDEEIKGRLEYPKDMAFVAEILLLNNVIFPESGKVDFAAPMINPATGTLNMRASFPNPKGSLKPGQFVRIRLEGAVRPNALIVPQRSILQGSKGKFVFIKDSDSKAQLRYVDVGDWYGDYWIINSGLQAGEEVIVDGAGKVDEGSVVNVIKTLPMPVFEESPPSENIQNH